MKTKDKLSDDSSETRTAKDDVQGNCDGTTLPLYLATSGYGVFKSSDSGATWAPFNHGLTHLDVRSLAIVRHGPAAHRGSRPGVLGPNTLYAGTPGGVFKIR